MIFLCSFILLLLRLQAPRGTRTAASDDVLVALKRTELLWIQKVEFWLWLASLLINPSDLLGFFIHQLYWGIIDVRLYTLRYRSWWTLMCKYPGNLHPQRFRVPWYSPFLWAPPSSFFPCLTTDLRYINGIIWHGLFSLSIIVSRFIHVVYIDFKPVIFE